MEEVGNIAGAEKLAVKGELEKSLYTVNEINERIGALQDRVRVLNGRVFDDATNDEESAPRPVRSGQVGRMESLLEDAQSCISLLDIEISRLERL